VAIIVTPDEVMLIKKLEETRLRYYPQNPFEVG